MAVKTDSPQIAALKLAAENRLGKPLGGRADFTVLASDIERVTHDHLAENTLRRIWGNMKGYSTVFTRTLDVLSRYCGYDHWKDFCETLKIQSRQESGLVRGGEAIRVEDLCIGDRIRIGWMPDRLCIVEYMGGRTFKAVKCHNSTLQNGDSFECSIMLRNYPLFLDNLVHGGELCQRYSIGLENGLTTLEKL